MLQIFQSVHGQWYWRFKARNGKSIAVGGEGYKTRAGAQRAFNRLCSLLNEQGYCL